MTPRSAPAELVGGVHGAEEFLDNSPMVLIRPLLLCMALHYEISRLVLWYAGLRRAKRDQLPLNTIESCFDES